MRESVPKPEQYVRVALRPSRQDGRLSSADWWNQRPKKYWSDNGALYALVVSTETKGRDVDIRTAVT